MSGKRIIVLTGGGTMGHVTPHLAIIPRLQAEGYEIHYVGTADGMEAAKMQSIPGIVYHAVKTGKLRRYFSWQNFIDPFRVVAGAFQSAHLMGKLRPNVVFSKGGFVAVPVVYGAKFHRIPVLCHESDLTPGLANKLSKPCATRMVTTFPECAKALGKKAECVGTPLRPDLYNGTRERGLEVFGFTGEKPVLLMMGGSLGAQRVNEALRAALPALLPVFDVAHLCGRGNLDAALEGTAGYCQKEFLDRELPDALACADLVLSRAGSNAIAEFQALAKPMLLVPYPVGAGRGDQVLNAESFRQRGLCKVLTQDRMTGETLAAALLETWEDREALTAALRAAPPADGTDRVMALIHEIERKD